MDLIIRGEYRVYPREIDEVLDERPAVGPPSCAPLYDAVGEEFGTAADMYALALRRTDTRGTFMSFPPTVRRSSYG
jgi:hypothetical protein